MAATRQPVGADLRKAYLNKFGPAIAANAIARKSAVLSTSDAVSRLLSRYIDERAKPEAKRRKPSSALERQMNEVATADIIAGVAPQRAGVDYLASSSQGLRFHGIVLRAIEDLAGKVGDMAPSQAKEVVRRWWIKQRAKRVKKGYHWVFSLHQLHSARISERGVPVDDVLVASVTEALLAFNTRFYPNTSIGWVAGAHHDKAHTHTHLLLFPATANGKGLNVSPDAPTVVAGQQIRVDYQDTIQRSYQNAVMHWVKTLDLQPYMDPKVRRSGIAEAMAGFSVATDTFLKQQQSAGIPNPDLTMDAVLGGWAPAVTGSDFPERFKALHKVIVDGEKAFGSYDATGLSKIEDRLRSALHEHEKHMAGLRATTERIRGLFKEWNAAPDRYAMVRYLQSSDNSPISPGFSPSGTLTGLGYKTPHSFADLARLPRPMPSKADVARRLNERLERLTALLTLQRQQMPTAPALAGDFVDQQYRRVLRVLYSCGNPLLNACLMRLGRPTVTATVPELHLRQAVDPTHAREILRALSLRSTRELGRIFHTATPDELVAKYREQQFARQTALPLAGLPDLGGGRDGDAAECGSADDDLGPIELVLPRRPSLIPENANFIEREALRPVATRSMTDIRAELRETEEAIARLLTIQPRDRFISL